MHSGQNYTTLSGPISVREVVEAMNSGKKSLKVTGLKEEVSLASNRLLTFTKGHSCVECGIPGEFFLVQVQSSAKGKGTGHLNLWATKDNYLVLMTSDHIIPKAKGGNNSLSNRQPMCCTCNFKKGSLLKGESPTSDVSPQVKQYSPSRIRGYLKLLTNICLSGEIRDLPFVERIKIIILGNINKLSTNEVETFYKLQLP